MDKFILCEKIMWNINEAKSDRDTANNANEESEPEKKELTNEQLHVMICYNTGN
jgi:hypothetical protein